MKYLLLSSACDTTDLIQIATSSLVDHGDHSAHARGLAALLGIDTSPLSLLGIAAFGHLSINKSGGCEVRFSNKYAQLVRQKS